MAFDLKNEHLPFRLKREMLLFAQYGHYLGGKNPLDTRRQGPWGNHDCGCVKRSGSMYLGQREKEYKPAPMTELPPLHATAGVLTWAKPKRSDRQKI